MKKFLKVFLIVFLTVVVVLATTVLIMYFHRSDPSDKENYATTNPWIFNDTKIGAHRCGGGDAPEETLRAFRTCLENDKYKADILEFDLRLTKDNQLVLLHDDELDRTSDSEEVFGEKGTNVYDKTYAELRQLNMGAKFISEDNKKPYENLSGNQVPDDIRIFKFTDALNYILSKGDYQFIMEIKDEGERGRKAADLVYAELQKRHLTNKVILGTFNPEVFAYLRNTYPDVYLCGDTAEALNFYGSSLINSPTYTPNCQSLILPYSDYSESYMLNLGTTRCVNYAHKNNLSMIYWTVNDEDDMRYLMSIGADVILTDHPDKLYEVKYGSLKYD